MSWTQLLTNPEGITRIFRQPPSLDKVDLHELNIHRDGPRLVIRFDLSEFPENPPIKWEKENFNKVQIRLVCLGMQRLDLHGWEKQNDALIRFTENESKLIEMSIEGKTTKLKALCERLLLDSISAYRDR